jgi:hypothetical protein
MLARLPLQPVSPDTPGGGAAQTRPLAALTTRAPDDASIALLDAWATTADVLTFYQERIANEGFLRTATERRSVLELARAIGYELNPGVAASTYLAFTVEGAQGAPGRATIPLATRVLSIPGQNEKPQTYETIEAIEAKAEWNALLPVQSQPQVLTGASTGAWITGLDTQLRTGDVLLLIHETPSGVASWALRSLTDVTPDTISGRTRVRWRGPLQLGARPVPQGFKVTIPGVFAMRQRMALFGHDAPEWRAMPANVMSSYAGYKVSDDPNQWLVFEWPNLEVPAGSSSVDLDAIYPKIVSGSLVVLETPTTTARPARLVAAAAGSINEVQFAVMMQDGRLLHTVRHADGSWQPAADMGAAAGIAGQVQALAAAPGGNNEVQFAVAMRDGHLWHTIRHADGTWQPAGDMGVAAVIAGQVQAVAAAGSNNDVQFAVAMQDGRLLHTIRFGASLTWQPAGDMGAAIGQSGQVQAITAASVGGNEVHFAVAMQDGHLWHTIRHADGTWQPAGDMGVAAGLAGKVQALAAAAADNGRDVQFAVATQDGHLWHTIRFGTALTWQPAGDMGTVAGIPGRVRSMAAAPGGPGEVQFSVAMLDGRLLHTTRHADGSWQPAGDMRKPASLEPAKTGLYEVVKVVGRARTDFTLSRQVTSLTLDPKDDLHAYPLRDTILFAQSTWLPLAAVPIPDPVRDHQITLDRVIAGLDAGRTVIVAGRRIRVRVSQGPITMVPAVGPAVQLEIGDSLIVTEAPSTYADGSAAWRLHDATGREGLTTHLQPGELIQVPALDTDPLVSEVVWVDHLETTMTGTTLALTSSLRHWFDRTTVTVRANVARSTHGESVREVLGTGSAAQPNQRFKLRKPPLTYIASPTPTGGQSTLQIWVDEVKWDEQPSLYKQPPDGRVYTVRMDDDGTTSVIFGDGEQGRRLPSGSENVTAVYRSGMGLQGQVDAGKLTLMQTRPFGVRDVVNPLAGTGAAPAEALEEARANAPLTVLTINRLVSLRDFENFSAAFAGIAKAQAVPAWDGQRRVVYITLAGVGGKAVDPGSASFVNLSAAIRNFGDPVREVRLDTYERILFRLLPEVLVDPNRDAATVLTAVTRTLRAAYAFDARRFGQPVTAAEIITIIQSIAGVTATRLRKLYFAGDPNGPNQVEPPAFLPSLSGRWDDTARHALPAQLLLLDPQGLTVSPMPP